MTEKDDILHFAKLFFALNLGLPLLVHLLIALIHLVGPDLRQLWLALLVIGGINLANITYAIVFKGWPRIALITITAFNILSLFAMGALSFFTSLFGWLHIVPHLIEWM